MINDLIKAQLIKLTSRVDNQEVEITAIKRVLVLPKKHWFMLTRV